MGFSVPAEGQRGARGREGGGGGRESHLEDGRRRRVKAEDVANERREEIMAEDNGSRLRDAELGGVAGLILRIHYIIALFFY